MKEYIKPDIQEIEVRTEEMLANYPWDLSTGTGDDESP